MPGRSILFLGSVTFMAMFHVGSNAQDQITIDRRIALSDFRLASSGNEKLSIPKKISPSADERLIQAATQIKKIDQTLAQFRAGEEFSEAQIEAFAEARNVAVDNLIWGQSILTGTAGGQFPRSSQNAVTDMLNAITLGLKEPKGRDIVTVEITFNPLHGANFAIEYQSYTDFVSKIDQWSTYQKPQSLNVGTYNFRVTYVDKGKQCSELVPVISQPTKRAICGRLVP